MAPVITIRCLESMILTRSQFIGKDPVRQFSKTPKNMNKYVPSNQSLPLSPLLDEQFYLARENYRCPKSGLNLSLTPLQRAARKNVFAQALATPVRKCRLTGVMLPRFFLLDFTPIASPLTGHPWYMPRSLTSKSPANAKYNPREETCPDNSSISLCNVNATATSCHDEAKLAPTSREFSKDSELGSEKSSKHKFPRRY